MCSYYVGLDCSGVLHHCVRRRELPERFASCPPAFGLLLYLRKALRQPAPQAAVRAGLRKPPFVATGTEARISPIMQTTLLQKPQKLIRA
jgi:hypothetical protein